jgi:thiamine-phosphate pyrophosphorylase
LLEPTGPGEIQNLKREIKIPIIALGGINEDNIKDVLDNRADGVAVISSIMNADNPERVAIFLSNKIKEFKKNNIIF